MDDFVCVVVGTWEFLDDGQWKFNLDKSEKVRAIRFCDGMSVDDLRIAICRTFLVDCSKTILSMSYWVVGQKPNSSESEASPFRIEFDNDLLEFRRYFVELGGLNILASFSEISGDKDGDATEPSAVASPDDATELSDNSDCSLDETMLGLIDRVEAEYIRNAKRNVDSVTALTQSPPNFPLTKTRSDYWCIVPGCPQPQPCEVQVCGGSDSGASSPLASGGIHNSVVTVMGIESSTNLAPRESGVPSPSFNLGIPDLEPQHLEDVAVDIAGEPQHLEDVAVDITGEQLREDVPCLSDKENYCNSPSIISDSDAVFCDPNPQLDNLTDTDGDESFFVGRTFPSKAALKKSLSLFAIDNYFRFRFPKSDRSRLIAKCVDTNCSWRLYAKCQPGSGYFVVRTIVPEHVCDVESRAKYCDNATPKVLAHLLQPKFANGKQGPRACEVPNLVLSELNMTISYMKAWHAKEVAIGAARGNEEENFKLLSTYLHLLSESNHGTHTAVQTTIGRDGKSCFKYLFMAIGACISGWKHVRKVIVIDGTQMKGKYKGCLVAASGQDGNMQILPLAFGVVDSENDNSWSWFLGNLSQLIPDAPDLVFVSDRHPSIYAGLRQAYPQAMHAACAVHLWRNVKARYKCEGLASLVSKAARAYTVGEFRYWWTEIEKRSPACARYLHEIGLQHWTLSHCPVDRYNILSSNISESLNAAMAKCVDYPIISMLEFIRTMLMRWFASRREKAGATRTRCTPAVEAILVRHLKKSTDCAVVAASQWVYQVNDGAGHVYTVDLEAKTCTCRVFDVLKIPCCHAIAARKVKGVDIYSLIDTCYSTNVWRQVYESIIMPVPRAEDITIPAEVLDNAVHPPLTKRPAGRPRKVRISSAGECRIPSDSRTFRCGRCHQVGHNRATCKNPI